MLFFIRNRLSLGFCCGGWKGRGVEKAEEHKADLYSLRGSQAQPMNTICIVTWEENVCRVYLSEQLFYKTVNN